jgi:hypothetical protein
MAGGIIEALGLSGWKYSFHVTEKCTSEFIDLLLKNYLHLRNTHQTHATERS